MARAAKVRSKAGARNFAILHRAQASSGAHPASYLMGTEGSMPGANLPKRETDQSPPSSAEVKNGGATPPPPSRTSSWNIT
jgi:hypothetical protein